MKGRLGRVARQRSAKPCTAVRIRQAPLQKTPACTGVFLFNYYSEADSMKLSSSLKEAESLKTDALSILLSSPQKYTMCVGTSYVFPLAFPVAFQVNHARVTSPGGYVDV